MPELPEVETIRQGLNNLVVDQTIKSVWHDWPKSFPNSKVDVDNFIIGAKINAIKRRGKVLMFELSSKYTLLIHLKMTGQLVYVSTRELLVISYPSSVKTDNRQQKTEDSTPPGRWGGGHPSDSLIGKLPDKSTRVIFKFSSGGQLFFNDQRKFGWIKLIPTPEVANIEFMKKLGPEPLSADFTPKDFRERISRRQNSQIKAALLDQSVIAGVGNIYADEGLWAAKIHPAAKVNKLNGRQIYSLFREIKNVLYLGIEKGGSTDKNYVDAEGKKGSYLSYANVFRREEKPCIRCGEAIVKIRVAGRGTHICPRCQKAQ